MKEKDNSEKQWCSIHDRPFWGVCPECAPATPVNQGEKILRWTDDMVRSYIHYFKIGDWDKCTKEQMDFFIKAYREDHPNALMSLDQPAAQHIPDTNNTNL